MKIAIVRLSSLGDIVFCMASLQLIRRRFPDAEITWVADAKFADILDCNSDLQRVVKLGLKGLKGRLTIAGLRAELQKLSGLGPFDLVIDMHGMLKSALVSRLLGGPVSGLHPSIAKEPLATAVYRQRVRIPKDVIGVARYAGLAAAALGFELNQTELADHSPYLFAGAEDRAAVSGYFAGTGPHLLLVAGTSIGYKNYPAEGFAEVAAGLDAKVLICHGNEQEEATAQAIAQRAPNVSLLPRLTINRLKAAIGLADLVIGGDTGPTHMAWAMNVPSIALFGATPSNCIVATERNRVITSASPANYGRPNPADLSIRSIPPADIVRVAKELLGKYYEEKR
ncbi:lipopolysaccharide heptosyltransferase I [Geobacter pelophilus]|uniref:Lipopolysaccharide heptosyltransferase 1 n=1 Tax=Geoanaerobacter pelophilus TaxID=60036 RepID=A0AAW4L3N9_9BACT|nr:lipopolysaccharide heptosyltransferase I [Geoanaerobacter pelophilus]MBT0665568.1 lipopolysaccharide heptosyltransferase I [Geoanaerobacter pelophilus]